MKHNLLLGVLGPPVLANGLAGCGQGSTGRAGKTPPCQGCRGGHQVPGQLGARDVRSRPLQGSDRCRQRRMWRCRLPRPAGRRVAADLAFKDLRDVTTIAHPTLWRFQQCCDPLQGRPRRGQRRRRRSGKIAGSAGQIRCQDRARQRQVFLRHCRSRGHQHPSREGSVTRLRWSSAANGSKPTMFVPPARTVVQAISYFRRRSAGRSTLTRALDSHRVFGRWSTSSRRTGSSPTTPGSGAAQARGTAGCSLRCGFEGSATGVQAQAAAERAVRILSPCRRFSQAAEHGDVFRRAEPCCQQPACRPGRAVCRLSHGGGWTAHDQNQGWADRQRRGIRRLIPRHVDHSSFTGNSAVGAV